jgi:hypothetical protein
MSVAPKRADAAGVTKARPRVMVSMHAVEASAVPARSDEQASP